jgi:hypothetical protein
MATYQLTSTSHYFATPFHVIRCFGLPFLWPRSPFQLQRESFRVVPLVASEPPFVGTGENGWSKDVGADGGEVENSN